MSEGNGGNMERRNQVSSLFWAGIGVVFCAGSLPYGFGSAGVPGAGFLPFLAGLCLLGLSLLHLVLSIPKRGSLPLRKSLVTDFPASKKKKRILLLLGALLFYVIALERLGFAITSFLFMMVVIALDFRKWGFVVLASFLFTAFFHILFRVLLRVPLPVRWLSGPIPDDGGFRLAPELHRHGSDHGIPEVHPGHHGTA